MTHGGIAAAGHAGASGKQAAFTPEVWPTRVPPGGPEGCKVSESSTLPNPVNTDWEALLLFNPLVVSDSLRPHGL